jgi:hypothetical protein
MTMAFPPENKKTYKPFSKWFLADYKLLLQLQRAVSANLYLRNIG